MRRGNHVQYSLAQCHVRVKKIVRTFIKVAMYLA